MCGRVSILATDLNNIIILRITSGLLFGDLKIVKFACTRNKETLYACLCVEGGSVVLRAFSRPLWQL